MPSEFGADAGSVVVPIVAIGFIALVFLVTVVVIVSRVIRLACGGPDAERLRQQLLAQQRRGHRDASSSAMGNQQALFDLQQQQIVIEVTNGTMNTTPPN